MAEAALPHGLHQGGPAVLPEREGPIPNDGSFLETMKKRFAKARAEAPAPASPLDDSSLRGPPG